MIFSLGEEVQNLIGSLSGQSRFTYFLIIVIVPVLVIFLPEGVVNFKNHR
jgi:hypothetical protein